MTQPPSALPAHRPPSAETGPADGGWAVHRHRDPVSGVVADVRTDGLPVGLALPPELVERPSRDVAVAVLRTLVAASAGARELLEAQSAEDGW